MISQEKSIYKRRRNWCSFYTTAKKLGSSAADTFIRSVNNAALNRIANKYKCKTIKLSWFKKMLGKRMDISLLK